MAKALLTEGRDQIRNASIETGHRQRECFHIDCPYTGSTHRGVRHGCFVFKADVTTSSQSCDLFYSRGSLRCSVCWSKNPLGSTSGRTIQLDKDVSAISAYLFSFLGIEERCAKEKREGRGTIQLQHLAVLCRGLQPRRLSFPTTSIRPAHLQHANYRKVTAAELRSRKEPPTKVKMLVRDFIDDSLYNVRLPHFPLE